MAAISYHQVGDSLDSDIDTEQTEFISESDATCAIPEERRTEYVTQQQDTTPDNLVTVSEQQTLIPEDDLITDHTPFRVSGFANKQTLAGWFPRIDDDGSTSSRFRLSKRNQALLLQVALIAIIFATNLFILTYVRSKYPSKDGVGLLFAGDCDTVKNSNRWLHLLINVLSTGMLSASTFCIQLQASPTRADIDKMHKRNKWLDIGAPSLRNLRYIGRWRLASCIVLALSSLPIHLIFNSAVFQSLASNDYTVAVVKDSFTSGADWNLSTAERNRQGDPGWDTSFWALYRDPPGQSYQSIIENMQKDVMSGLYEFKNVSDCYALYEDYWAATQGNVVVVAKNQTGDNDSLLLYTFVVPRYDNFAKNLWAAGNGTGQWVSFTSAPPPVTTVFLGPPRYEASYCLVQYATASKDRCRLEYSTDILTAVCTLNFVKLLALLFVEAVLSTLGDAISSFIQDPDESTKNMCLATKYDFLRKGRILNKWTKKKPDPGAHPREWKMSRKRWLSAATWTQWTSLIILMGLLVTSLKNRHFHLTLHFFRSLGFGSVNELTYLDIELPRGDPIGLISNVLIINSPQLLFSIMYSVAGAMLTTFLVQREFSLMYAKAHRKTLRVSEPVGIQRSSYFISVPLRYGIPFNLFSAVFHWLISQSYFIARITALLPNGNEDYGNSFTTLGYSPYAMIITGGTAFINLMTIVLIGCRRYDYTMRMLSTNSMAISAACHVLDEDREYGDQLPLQWGVLEIGEDGIGHCSFTTAPCHEIRKAQEGVLYQ
ncbi:hypothetical protein EV127DRAFT_352591 [Xylaria flabelliformis]|nr:hypothetical protein EV127DRAFT_352591 [Xylaria flabelliformis]